MAAPTPADGTILAIAKPARSQPTNAVIPSATKRAVIQAGEN